jgi:hypothetical protein
MIKIKALTKLADFEGLKKGDMVVCEWDLDSYKGKKRTRFASYEVVDNKADYSEIILQTQMNVYFNYKMFLDSKRNGVSNLKNIVLLTQEG